MKRSISRRAVLKRGGVAALATLAGCSVSADSEVASLAPTSVAPTSVEPTSVPPTRVPPTSTPVPTATLPPTATLVPEPTPTAATEPAGPAIRIASAARDDAPQDALVDSLAGFDGPATDIEFLDTFEYQDRIGTFLAEDFDVVAWFSGYRNRQFAQEGLVLDVSDVWEQSPRLMPAARAASTNSDGSFVDGRIKDVFTQWEQLLPYQPSRSSDGNDRIRRRSQQLAAEAEEMASFLDRETTPQFALICGDVLAEFLEDPNSIDSGLERLETLSAELL